MKKYLVPALVFVLTLAMVITMFCCPDTDVQKYAKNTPVMDPREYFNGKVEATGIFIDRSGMADPYFHIAMNGTWKGEDGAIAETFTYSDGRKNERTWNIRFVDKTHFIGTAHDVVGEARGEISGNAMHIRYVLRVPVKGGKTYDLSMSDWMWRLDAETVINRIEMSKFGFRVGQLIVTFRKL